MSMNVPPTQGNCTNMARRSCPPSAGGCSAARTGLVAMIFAFGRPARSFLNDAVAAFSTDAGPRPGPGGVGISPKETTSRVTAP